MLNDAIHRRGDMQVDVIAVLNDTTGSFLFYDIFETFIMFGLLTCCQQ